jgi:hypothetical protein
MLSTKNIIHSIIDVPTSWVFEKYCSLNEKLTGQTCKIKSIFNPKDRTPSMYIFPSGNLYVFKDFSTGLGGDCIDLVANVLAVPRAKAISVIIEEYNNYCKLNEVEPRKFTIQSNLRYNFEDCKTREWNSLDAKYWNQYNISSELLGEYGIKPLESFTFSYYSEKGVEFLTSSKNYTYGFFDIDNRIYKIYQPYGSKKYLKLKDYLQGSDQLPVNGKNLFICSGMKDGLALKTLFSKVNFIAPDSEQTIINEKIITDLKLRFSNIFVLFDTDEAGVSGMKKYNEKYGLKTILLPKHKDLADFVKYEGIKESKKVINQLIK